MAMKFFLFIAGLLLCVGTLTFQAYMLGVNTMYDELPLGGSKISIEENMSGPLEICHVEIGDVVVDKTAATLGEQIHVLVELKNDGSWVERYQYLIEKIDSPLARESSFSKEMLLRLIENETFVLDLPVADALYENSIKNEDKSFGLYQLTLSELVSEFELDNRKFRRELFDDYCKGSTKKDCKTLFVDIFESANVSCQVTEKISGDFKFQGSFELGVKYGHSEQKVRVNAGETKWLKWILIPQSPGRKTISVFRGGKEPVETVVKIQPIKWVPYWMVQWGSIITVVLGPAITLPWLISAYRRHRITRKER